MKKDRNINESLFFIKKGLQSLKGQNTLSEEKIDNYIKEIENLHTLFKGLKRLLLLLFSALLLGIIIIIFLSLYNRKINSIDTQINNLKNDSLIFELLEIKKTDEGDSISTTYNYLTKDGKVVSYQTLSKENDSLLRVLVDETKKSKKDTEKMLEFSQDKQATSQELINKNNELIKIIEKNNILEAKLELVQKKYPIKFSIKDDYISIESKQLDSSMILLQYFRDRITYDSKNNVWKIKK